MNSRQNSGKETLLKKLPLVKEKKTKTRMHSHVTVGQVGVGAVGDYFHRTIHALLSLMMLRVHSNALIVID